MTDKNLPGARARRRIPDPQHAPMYALRLLLKSAFEAKTLRRFCQDREPFRELLYRFSENDGLEDLIDEVFEFCRTRDLWEELLDGVAEEAPRYYNETAARFGWPPAPKKTTTQVAQVSTIPQTGSTQTRGPSASTPSAYDDVEIHVTSGPDSQYQVTIHSASAGDTSDRMDKRWTDTDLSQWLSQLELGQVDRDALVAIGKQLFLGLFAGHVRDAYAEARGKAANGLRLRLRFDSPELQVPPWELLWDAGPRREFLVLSGRAWITRYLPVPHGTPALAVDPPLGVLIVSASPQDQPRLDVDAEEAAVRAALAPLQARDLVHVESLPHAQVMTLRDALRDVQPHILHFVGHGAMGPEGGALLLEDADGLARILPAGDLRILLQYTPTVRLAVLNACATAQSSADLARFDTQRRAVLGVGPELVRAGLGAVVAMQFSLSDQAARFFAQDFYRTLARLEPVDQAVSRAREALMLEFGEDQRDWATPVLFLRAPDGAVFAQTSG